MTELAGRPDEWIVASGGDALEVYEWLKANGVDEWLPEQPDIFVSEHELTYTSYVWAGQRGWDLEQVQRDPGGWLSVSTRTVPLRSPVTPRLRELARKAAPAHGVFRLFENGVEVR